MALTGIQGLAERGRFELPQAVGLTTVFETAPFANSGISPSKLFDSETRERSALPGRVLFLSAGRRPDGREGYDSSAPGRTVAGLYATPDGRTGQALEWFAPTAHPIYAPCTLRA